jgi:signal transduction histidine kinase
VRRLQAAARRLAAGDLDVRVDTDEGPAELRALAETFNTTAVQLAQLRDSQQRFVADASHQLRTPLTALRLRLETLAPAIAEPARPKLEAAIAETSRLARLVQSLLVLARSDATAAVCERVDLTTVVLGRYEAWAPVAEDDSKTLACECPPDLQVQAVPGAIEQILDNLISNGLEAAPPGTTITVRADSREGGVEVHVIDQGPGMSAEDRRLAFRRFWRPATDEAASANAGFGLGLAIVHQLATRCGGDARLEPGPDGIGLDAVVIFRTVARARQSPDRAAGEDPEPLPAPHLRHSERSSTSP